MRYGVSCCCVTECVVKARKKLSNLAAWQAFCFYRYSWSEHVPTEYIATV